MTTYKRPSQFKNESGETRSVGFEVEFGAKDCVEVARRIQKLFGGELKKIDPHAYKVIDTNLGTFSIELDTQFIHPEKSRKLDSGSLDEFLQEAKDSLCETLGNIGKMLVPYEVVSPPIPLDRLHEMTALMDVLRELGVEGTDEAWAYAFGVHINPEVSSSDPISILNHLRAFVLLSDWLREVNGIDLARRLSPYINTFPRAYAVKILSMDYCPGLDQFIDDYLHDNPTRNRELDLLPLFTYLDKNRVLEKLKDGLTSARPTFHYRLPDCRLNDPNWSLAGEWNLWVQVEELANNSRLLETMSAAYIQHFDQILPRDWSAKVENWMRK